MNRYEAVIGLEVHAQLTTRTKLFCGCPTSYGAGPNTRVCPVCLGLPGALPVVNRRAVELAIRTGLAVGSTIAQRSVFARKNYFYPDCPKNYQISQFDLPLCEGGSVAIDAGRVIRIERIHLEEDAGKLLHDADGDHSRVDLNRCGVPLVEIVSEPDVRTPAEARAFVRRLRDLLRYLDVCDGNMEEGSLRCDANVSVRKSGGESLGVKTEVKNLNSFKFVEQALSFEIKRQTRALDSGEAIVPETLLWDPRRGEARTMRSKEEAQDYRYFPEPDLLILQAPGSLVRSIEQTLVELPEARRKRFREQYGLSAGDAGALAASRGIADYFEAVADAADPGSAAKWIMGEVMRELNDRKIEISALGVPPGDLADLIEAVDSGRVNTRTGRDVFREMVESGRAPADIIAEKGLEQIADDDAIRAAAARVIAENEIALEKYLRGKHRVLQFFVGQLMKTTGGKANPERAEAILKELLEHQRGES